MFRREVMFGIAVVLAGLFLGASTEGTVPVVLLSAMRGIGVLTVVCGIYMRRKYKRLATRLRQAIDQGAGEYWTVPLGTPVHLHPELSPRERALESYATSSTGSALSPHRVSAVSRCRHSAPLALEWSTMSRRQCRHSAMNCPLLRSGRKV